MADANASILIVDDKPDKLLALETLLSDLSSNIVRAYGGREALRQVLQREFAVILLDVNMPDMDGFETAQLIRQRKSSAHVPIIFLTAMSDEMHVARGYELGAVDYILTPVVPQVLRSKVAVFLDLFRKTRQVEIQADRLRQRATQLHRLTGASLAINSAQSVTKIVQIATETARELIGVHQAISFALPGHHAAHAVSYVSYSEKYSSWGSRRPDINEPSQLQTLVRGMNKPMRMSPLELETHAPQVETPNAPALRGLLAAPLTGRNGRNIGTILLSDKASGEFNDDDQAVLVQLAQVAAVAIENAIFAEEREANRLKDEFLSTLSHELRTPLSAISGWVQLMKINSERCDISHGIEVIERNVAAQTKLIEDLLDLSRIASGKLRLNAKPILVTPVVEAAVDALRPVVQEKGIRINTDLDAADVAVHGDSDRLQQVFWNLLSNAGKFTPAGGEITVRLTRHDEEVRLSITDTGVGIDPAFIPYVFERFRQADSTSSRRHGGLGIGLTIVQQIVSLHHGTVSAHSEGKGRGSTFTVTLPLTKNSHAHVHPAPEGNNGHSMPSLKELRVLVVDDDPDCREVVAEMLQRCEAEVTTAASASDALKLMPTARPNIVVTDLAMPDQDGFELLRDLRNLPPENGGSVPAIALTAYARPEDRAHAMRAGFQGYMSKPPEPAALADLVLQIAQPQRTEPSETVV